MHICTLYFNCYSLCARYTVYSNCSNSMYLFMESSDDQYTVHVYIVIISRFLTLCENDQYI